MTIVCDHRTKKTENYDNGTRSSTGSGFDSIRHRILNVGQVENFLNKTSHICVLGHMLDQKCMLQQLFVVWPIGVFLLQTCRNEIFERW